MKFKRFFSVNSIKYQLIFSLFLFILYIAFLGYTNGWFRSIDALQDGIENFGFLGIFVFIVLQIIQVILPFVPNQVVSVAGVLIFGVFWGFLYNYIGVFVGSFIVYGLARKYGKKIISKFFSKTTINKYTHHSNNPKFTKLFALAMIFPGFPDDFLCYLAGTSNINLRDFTLIIFIGRAFSQIGYSLFLDFFM